MPSASQLKFRKKKVEGDKTRENFSLCFNSGEPTYSVQEPTYYVRSEKKVGNASETDSIKSHISSKTSRVKRDSTKR